MEPTAEIVGIGSCTVDYFARVPRLLGPEEKINSGSLEVHAGGVTANNLTQAARLGARTGWLGLIGDDDNGRLIQKQFSDDGMDLSGIDVVKGQHSSVAWIPVDPQGQRCIYMFPNVTGKISIFQVRNRFSAHIQKAKHFHTEASQIPIAPIHEAMRVAKAAGVRVFFDLDVSPSYISEAGLSDQESLVAALKDADVLMPCLTAARELTGEDNNEKIARALLQVGPPFIALTLGAQGCLIATRKQVIHVPPFKVKVVDTTGAGDAFVGGLSYALLQGWEPEQTGTFANACAALCCTKIGARAMSKRDEVVDFNKSKRPSAAASF